MQKFIQTSLPLEGFSVANPQAKGKQQRKRKATLPHNISSIQNFQIRKLDDEPLGRKRFQKSNHRIGLNFINLYERFLIYGPELAIAGLIIWLCKWYLPSEVASGYYLHFIFVISWLAMRGVGAAFLTDYLKQKIGMSEGNE